MRTGRRGFQTVVTPNVASLLTGGLLPTVNNVNSFVEPSNFALRVLLPREVGTAPTVESGTPPTMPSGHAILKAHPEVPYNIRPAVKGGAYPYTYALSNEPSGMTIDSRTGVIHWPSPFGSSANPTLHVTDAEGTSVSVSWPITVTTSGFRVVSSEEGSDGNGGTLNSPWQTLQKVHQSGLSADTIIFRGGDYDNSGIARSGTGGAWERIEFNASSRAVKWIGYHGETVVIDDGYVQGSDPGAQIRFTGSATNPVYLDNLTVRNVRNMLIQFVSGSCHYPVFRRLTLRDIHEGADGDNPGGIMAMSNYTAQGWFGVFQDMECHDLVGAPGLKLYSQRQVLVDGNLFRDSNTGVDMKADLLHFEVRGNEFQRLSNEGLVGQYAGEDSGLFSIGEIRFNNINAPAAALAAFILNQQSNSQLVYVVRNTIAGKCWPRNVDSADGPFVFRRNVRISSDAGTAELPRIDLSTVGDLSRITSTDDLTGAPGSGIIDSGGSLIGAYRTQYLGTRGHEVL